MPSSSPTEIGDWTVIEHLGSGAYGITFLVSRGATENDSRYALKWMRADAEPNARLRFINETWALSHLEHGSIPQLIDSGEWEGRPFIVMTLAPGQPLKEQLEQQLKQGEVFGELRVLAITIKVLDALAYMHERNIYHRDIKEDNIIATESTNRVTIVDLGVCRGDGQPNDIHTFRGGVGAARYCPPTKLTQPSFVHPTHDVFAVGVVGYLLLTGRHPWSVAPEENTTSLANLMLSTTPEQIHDLNNRVSRETSVFFHTLLTPEDSARPSAAAARNEAQSVQRAVAERIAPPFVVSSLRFKLSRVIRDPLHGDIRLTETEWLIVKTPEFQRLRWIRQLGLSNLVYPGAEHTRFSHALGTMHVADRIMRSIEDRTGQPFSTEERHRARCYALVHDISHIAFGHTIEDELQYFQRHDANEARLSRLLFSDDSAVGTLLRSTDYGRDVLAHFDLRTSIVRQTWLRELVQAPCGADVLDYVDRDAYHCGLEHRIDSAIYRRFIISGNDRAEAFQRRFVAQVHGQHGLRLDAEFALESILRERFALFMKVYTHPAKIAAGAMLGKALAEVLLHSRRSLSSSDRRQQLTERKIERMGDDELLTALKGNTVPTVRQMAERLLARRLYKPAYQARALKPSELGIAAYEARQAHFAKLGTTSPARRREIEAELAKSAGLRPADVIVYCTPKAPGLQKVQQYVEVHPGTNELRDEIFTPHLRMMQAHLGLWSIYVLVPPDCDQNARNRLGLEAETFFGIANDLEMERRQLLLFPQI